jgi:hypothetical protein
MTQDRMGRYPEIPEFPVRQTGSRQEGDLLLQRGDQPASTFGMTPAALADPPPILSNRNNIMFYYVYR